MPGGSTPGTVACAPADRSGGTVPAMDVGVVVNFDGGRNRGMEALAACARQLDASTLTSMWLPEHVVFVQGATSLYPYSTEGLNLGRRPGMYDPLIGLTVAATVTERIRLGTGVLILPQREPVTLAQQLVALDHAAQGRIDLGIGVGWLREECETLGVPWERRGARTDEYIGVLRALWRDDVVDHDGEFVHLTGALAWPKPVQDGGLPIWVGGNTPPALRRAGRLGDGWFGWNLDVDQVRTSIATIRTTAAAAGRDPSTVRLKVGRAWPGDLGEVGAYVAALAPLGVGEVLIAPATAGVEMAQRLDELDVAVAGV